MNQKNRALEEYGLWAVDLVAIIISFLIATYIRFGNMHAMRGQDIHFLVLVCFLLASTVYSFFLEWNRNFVSRGYGIELAEVFKYNAVLLVVVETIMFFTKWADVFSRLTMVYFFLINIGITYIIHVVFKNIFRKYYSSELTVIKVWLIAQKDVIEETAERLKKTLDIHYQLDAAVCVDSDMTGEYVAGIPVVAGRENLLETALQNPLDEVFINIPDISQSETDKIISGFDDMGIVCHLNLDAINFSTNRSRFETFGDYNVISYTHFQSSYKRLLVKRLMDIIGGLLGSIITIVMTPFIAIAIKTDSKGPVFFSQTRIGRNGRRFKMYKFRSMYIDAEERKKELEKQNEMNGLMFKMENDPRVTKVGKFLRKTSLDEFPQFFNILKGDMSMVGTRPPTEEEFSHYNMYYRRRMSMTPGLTGMWQVNGRSEVEDFDDVVKYDLEYIDNWSLSLDCKILWKTVSVVFRHKGAE